MTVHAVFFDLFGTLVRPFPGGPDRADLPAMADALGADREAFHRAWVDPSASRSLGEFGPIEGDIRQAAESIGAAPDEAAVREAARIRVEYTRGSLVSWPDAVPTLARLERAGYRMALVSNATAEVSALFAETVMAPFMAAVAISADLHVKKPDPRIFRWATDALGVDPGECAFVGDGYGRELTGSSGLGMRAIHLLVPGVPVSHDFQYEGDRWEGERIASLGELPPLLGL